MAVGGLHRRAYRPRPDDPPGKRYELDGRYIVDEDSLYCAFGAAVNGPGGYFGWNLDALDDCMSGRFGVTPPFTLVWTASDTARTSLGGAECPGAGAFFEDIAEICAQRQVDLILR